MRIKTDSGPATLDKFERTAMGNKAIVVRSQDGLFYELGSVQSAVRLQEAHVKTGTWPDGRPR